MIDKIVFLNESWLWPILIGGIILLVIFFVKDWMQAGKRRFLLKVILAILSVVSLALIALKPAVSSGESAGKMLLLTPGYLEEQLDSLRKEHRKIKVLNYTPGQPIPGNVRTAEKVFIAGHGLREYDLWQVEGVPAEYLGGSVPEGIVKLNYERERSVGERLMVKGLYQDPQIGNLLVLEDPAGAGLDSIVLNSENEQTFQLITQLKVAGKFVFSLAEKDSLGNLIFRDPLPITVSEKEKIKILVLNSFPTFETRTLKNFLAEAGHELVVRSQITRGRFKYEYLNTEPVPVGSLTETALENFDLLLLDAPSLRNLSGSQKSALEKSVREAGLGIFIQSDESFFNLREELVPFAFERVQREEVRLADWQDVVFTRFPYRIEKDFGIQTIHTSNDQVATAYKRLGEGRIGTSVISNTYSLSLEGNTETYRQFWSRALEEVARKQSPAAAWEQEGKIIYPNEPFQFVLRSDLEEPEISTGGTRIPLKQDLHFPWLWKGTTWPQQEGWNSVSLDTTADLDYYVVGENEWTSLSSVKTKEANQQFFEVSNSIENGQYPLEPVNPLWFYAIFLVCMGGLWLEPKV
jgi:hypothetical protein